MNENILSVSSLEVILAGKKILNGISLEIEERTVTAIVGASGSGKSTLLRAMARLVVQSGGEILLHGQSIAGCNVSEYRSRVNLALQEPVLIGPKVEDDLRLPFDLEGMAGKAFPEKADMISILESVDLEPDILQRNITALSGGQRQRVAIARSLLLKPDVLLLDEPTSQLDILTAETVIRNLHGTFPELTVVVATHSAELLQLADRLVVIRNGAVESVRDEFKPEDLKEYLSEEIIR